MICLKASPRQWSSRKAQPKQATTGCLLRKWSRRRKGKIQLQMDLRIPSASWSIQGVRASSTTGCTATQRNKKPSITECTATCQEIDKFICICKLTWFQWSIILNEWFEDDLVEIFYLNPGLCFPVAQWDLHWQAIVKFLSQFLILNVGLCLHIFDEILQPWDSWHYLLFWLKFAVGKFSILEGETDLA